MCVLLWFYVDSLGHWPIFYHRNGHDDPTNDYEVWQWKHDYNDTGKQSESKGYFIF